MSRSRGNEDNLYPRVVAVLVDEAGRAEAVSALGPAVRVTDRDEIERAAAERAEARRDGELEAIAELEAEVRSLNARRTGNEAVHSDLLVEQRRTREAADWCEMQPTTDRDEAGQIAASAQTLEDHSRVVREANRRLERVLEQRAAAEAALEEARSELNTLGAAGFDETGVRRQMEAASRHLHEVTADYQARMSEVARRKAVVWELEDAAAAQESREHRAEPSGGEDQFQAMRAAVQAKFASPEITITVVDPEQLDEARRAASHAEAAAEEAAGRLTQAKESLSALENELTARTNESDSRAERHAAALGLQTQVAAVEEQLAGAEMRSRAEVDEATRAMTRAELTLERLRQDARDRRRKLDSFVSLVPEGQRPPDDADPVAHCGVIARALRAHADAMQPDLDHSIDMIERDRALAAGKADELHDRRVGLDTVVVADRTGAVGDLAAGVMALVLDDVVAVGEPRDDGHPERLPVEALLAVETDSLLIALTTDPSVVGWAIEQPGDLVGVTSVAALLELASDTADPSDDATNRPTK